MARPIDLVCTAAERVGDLLPKLTFVGGAVVGLLITETGGQTPRSTEDVDVIVPVLTRIEWYEVEADLVSKGFRNSPEGPVCRFTQDGLVLDVMPTNGDVLGFTNPWYEEAIATSTKTILPNGLEISLIHPLCFLATKFAAFSDPIRSNAGDPNASRDLEDIVMLMDGRPEILREVSACSKQLRTYLQKQFKGILTRPFIEESIEGQLGNPDRTRLPVILERMRRLAG